MNKGVVLEQATILGQGGGAMNDDERLAIIQTWPAEAWHCGQGIEMNEAGRLRLIDALQKREKTIEVSCFDGEGYTLELTYEEGYIRPFYLRWSGRRD